MKALEYNIKFNYVWFLAVIVLLLSVVNDEECSGKDISSIYFGKEHTYSMDYPHENNRVSLVGISRNSKHVKDIKSVEEQTGVFTGDRKEALIYLIVIILSSGIIFYLCTKDGKEIYYGDKE